MSQAPDNFDYYQHSRGRPGRTLLAELSLRMRREVFALFLRELRPTSDDRILDVGITGDTDLVESNAFERLYPYPDRLVGLGMEPLGAVRCRFPRIGLVGGDGLCLPFASGTFDIVCAHAIIEHVGCRAAQATLLREMLRVGQRCFVTTPNRWFPVELHTFLPLLHYLPPRWHRRILVRMGLTFYAQEANLNLLARSELADLFPPGVAVRTYLTPLGTNVIAIADAQASERACVRESSAWA